MKSTNKSFTFTILLFCFLLASCNSIGASTLLPTATSMSTAVPIVVSPTVAATAIPTLVLSTLSPVPTTAVIPTAVPPVYTATFADQVVQAFNNADYAWINAHMGSEFTFAGWQAGGNALPPAAAVDQLRTVYFGSGSYPIFQTGIDTTAVLGGVNPFSLWGPETAVTDVLYVTGLGSSARDEAMIILATDNAGTPDIFGLLSAFGGFAAYPLVAPPAGTASFADQVVQAFNNADYDWINAHMGSEFTIAGWLAGGTALPPVAAVDQLRTVYFGSGSTPIFQTGIDTTAVLGGVNPLSLWEPGTAVTDVLYVTGLGSSAHDEAMIILATDTPVCRISLAC